MTAEHVPVERVPAEFDAIIEDRVEDRTALDRNASRSPTRRPTGGSQSTSAAATRRRLRALLRGSAGLRQALLAKEVLDPPVATRHRRR